MQGVEGGDFSTACALGTDVGGGSEALSRRSAANTSSPELVRDYMIARREGAEDLACGLMDE